MEEVGGSPIKQKAAELDSATQEEYVSVSKLLKEFTDIPTIDKAWTFKSQTGMAGSYFFPCYHFSAKSHIVS